MENLCGGMRAASPPGRRPGQVLRADNWMDLSNVPCMTRAGIHCVILWILSDTIASPCSRAAWWFIACGNCIMQLCCMVIHSRWQSFEEIVSEIDVDMTPAGSPLGDSMDSSTYIHLKRWIWHRRWHDTGGGPIGSPSMDSFRYIHLKSCIWDRHWHGFRRSLAGGYFRRFYDLFHIQSFEELYLR